MEGTGCSNNKLIKIKNFFLKETQKKRERERGRVKGETEKNEGWGSDGGERRRKRRQTGAAELNCLWWDPPPF